MGSPWDEISNVVSNAGQGIANTARSAAQTAGNISRRYLGSAGYIPTNPLAPAQIASDYFNQEDKKKQAQAEEDAARQQLEQSTNQMDRVRAQQQLFAAQLKNNAFRDTGLLTNQVAANERRGMAQKLVEAKQNAASRGLVGSGFQKMNEAQARAEATANTASKQKQIQDQMQQQIMDAQDLSDRLGLEMGSQSLQNSDEYYRMAIQNMQNRSANISSLLQGGAALGGAYLARQKGV